MFLKQDKTKMDDFKRRKNFNSKGKNFLNQYFEKILLKFPILFLLFQNILSIV